MSDARLRTFVEEARRRQIVEGTIELVVERGYAGTSLSGIAARAGISTVAVRYPFAGALDAVEAEWLADPAFDLDAAPAEPADAVLRT